MIYFTKDYLSFFKELAAHNHKKWFDENRKRYEKSVRDPFQYFVTDLITEVSKQDPSIQITAKDAIFCINRDIRFSKDKSPYKLFNSAIISGKGRKDKSLPGMYIEFSPERLAVFGGIYRPDTMQLNKIRDYLMANYSVFDGLLCDQSFVTTFGSIKGEQYKRLSEAYQKAAGIQELLYNKQWYFEASLAPETLLEEDLIALIVKHYRIAFPLLQFFKKALQ